jgi:hypothetical protein
MRGSVDVVAILVTPYAPLRRNRPRIWVDDPCLRVALNHVLAAVGRHIALHPWYFHARPPEAFEERTLDEYRRHRQITAAQLEEQVRVRPTVQVRFDPAHHRDRSTQIPFDAPHHGMQAPRKRRDRHHPLAIASA